MGLATKLLPTGQIQFTYENDDGEEIEVLLPGVHEVCGECNGHGRHTNRNIDGNGITSSEWAEWDEDERETYLKGGYDVDCEACGGEKVVAVVDVEALERQDSELFKRYTDFVRSEADSRNERRYQERYGF